MKNLQEALKEIEGYINSKPDGKIHLDVETKISQEDGMLIIEVELECNCHPDEVGTGVMEHFWETHTLKIGAGTFSYGINANN